MTLLLSLEDITVNFGGKPLFEGLNMHMSQGEKICLYGKNGAGKTTLMRLITRELEQDAGKIFRLPGLTIGYLAQDVKFDQTHTVKQFILSGLPAKDRTAENEYLADMVMAPLSLNAQSLMASLSGGQQRRAALARTLVMDPDILLLDEPTNHLDLAAIEWLEDYLRFYRGAILCISHDRRFLMNMSEKVLWVDRGRIRTCPYGYEKFEDWLEIQIQQEARELQNLQKKIESEHDWTQGGVTARRKRNVRRMRELHRLREKLEQDKAAYKQQSQKIDLDPLKVINSSRIVGQFKNVSKSFVLENHKIEILKEFNHTILKGDRLGILGKNGSGKSTFLKMLIGDFEPDSGFIFRNKTTQVSYLDQARKELNVQKTLQETLCPQGGDYVIIGQGENQRTAHVCGYLKKFLFDPKMVNDKVATLSGGQQNRLLLAKILTNPGNLLILDEPTNDLDMDTLDMLQDILADYTGTLIVVSHDRDFLDRCVTEVMAFEGDAEVHTIFGGYSDYIKKREMLRTGKMPQTTPTPKKIEKQKPPEPKTKKLSYKHQYDLETLPQEIADLEQKIIQLSQELSNPDLYMKSPDIFDKSSKSLARAQQTLSQKESRYLELLALKEEA